MPTSLYNVVKLDRPSTKSGRGPAYPLRKSGYFYPNFTPYDTLIVT
jgi:hypothetical protein